MLVRRRVAQKEIQQNLQYGRSKTLITCCTSQLKDLVTRGEEVRRCTKICCAVAMACCGLDAGKVKVVLRASEVPHPRLALPNSSPSRPALLSSPLFGWKKSSPRTRRQDNLGGLPQMGDGFR
jgi:hypothetical protein